MKICLGVNQGTRESKSTKFNRLDTFALNLNIGRIFIQDRYTLGWIVEYGLGRRASFETNERQERWQPKLYNYENKKVLLTNVK